MPILKTEGGFHEAQMQESVECPLGGLRGGQAGSLPMEADWGVGEGAWDMAMQEASRKVVQMEGHSLEQSGQPPGQATEPSADGRGMQLGRLSPGREPGGSPILGPGHLASLRGSPGILGPHPAAEAQIEAQEGQPLS